VPLARTDTTARVSRLASGMPCLHAVALIPAGSVEPVRLCFSTVSGLPLCHSPVGSCNYFFVACSAVAFWSSVSDFFRLALKKHLSHGVCLSSARKLNVIGESVPWEFCFHVGDIRETGFKCPVPLQRCAFPM